MLSRRGYRANNGKVYLSELHTFFFYIILSINYNNVKSYKVNIKKGKETPTYLYMDLYCILNYFMCLDKTCLQDKISNLNHIQANMDQIQYLGYYWCMNYSDYVNLPFYDIYIVLFYHLNYIIYIFFCKFLN